MNPNQFSQAEIDAVYRAIRERRDMRHFVDKPLEEGVLQRLIEAAHLGPSVGFMQPWRFIRITDTELRKQIHADVEQERQRTAVALSLIHI